MARINIEDSLWSDPRFMRLCIALGDEMRAIGAVVAGWRTAQKWWCPNKTSIPQVDFIASGLPRELIQVGLAIQLADGIRMCGSEEHFAWWFQRAAAGRRGGEASAKQRSTVAKRDSSETKQIEPSSSSSSSSSSSKTKEPPSEGETPTIAALLPVVRENFTEATKILAQTGPQSKTKARPKSVDGKLVGSFIAAMVDAYSAKYRTRPILDGKTRGHIGRMLLDTPLPRLTNLYQAFLQMDDPWFKTKMHDFETFNQNLQKVQVALDTGGELGREKTWREIAGVGEDDDGSGTLRIADRETEDAVEE